MLLDDKFKLAVNYIQNLPPSGPYVPSNDEKLQFYSLYKQATEGPCKAKKPSFYDLIAKAKWDAWKKVSKLSKNEAKKKYVTLFSKVARKINNEESRAVLKKMASNDNNTSISTSKASGSDDNTIHLYGIMLSQPTRSVYWFCKLNSIPFEFHEINLLKGEQKTPEFTKINPLQKVPAITYKGKSYYESHTILRFLSREFDYVPSYWYPLDESKRLQVEVYLDWHHLNTRRACASIVFAKFFLPMRGNSVPEERLAELSKDLHICLKTFNKVFLGNENTFIGGNNPCIGDILAYQEIIQLDLINEEHRNAEKYPNLVKWISKMELLPYHNDIYSFVKSFIPSAKL